MKIVLDIDDEHIPVHVIAIMTEDKLTDLTDRRTVEAFLYVALHHFDDWHVQIQKYQRMS